MGVLDGNVDVNVYLDANAAGEVVDFTKPMRLMFPSRFRLDITSVVTGAAGSIVCDVTDAGDVSDYFQAGQKFRVVRGGGLNGVYTVTSATYAAGPPATLTIVVTETVPSVSAAGRVESSAGDLILTAVTHGDDSFTVGGDVTDLYTVGSTFVVYGSSNNNGVYTVETATYTALNGTTVIVVEEDVVAAGATKGYAFIGFGGGARYAEFTRATELDAYEALLGEAGVAEVATAFAQTNHPDTIAVGLRRLDDTGAADSLDEVLAENATWFGFSVDGRDQADIVAAAAPDTTGAAAWAETNEKLFVAQQSTADIRDTTYDAAATYADTDTASLLRNLARQRTVFLWHADDDEAADWAWLCAKSAADPDRTATTWAYATLSGITVDTHTSTQKTYLESKYANMYAMFRGTAVTWNGIGSGGYYADLIVLKSWYQERVAAALAQVLLDASARNQKIPYTDVGFQTFAGAVTKYNGQGETIGHFAEGSSYVDVPKVSDMSAAYRAARKVSIRGGATAAGAVHQIVLDFYITVV